MAGARWLARGVGWCSWPQGVKRAGRPLVAGADELGPATAVDEDVVERGAAQEAVVGRVDHGETVPEGTAGAVREFELEALLGLAAGVEDAHPSVFPAGDVLGLELRGKHEVDAEDVVETAVPQDWLRREEVDDPAVDVEMAVDLDRLYEHGEGDRDAH